MDTTNNDVQDLTSNNTNSDTTSTKKSSRKAIVTESTVTESTVIESIKKSDTIIPVVNVSNIEIYNSYILDGQPYRIYLRGTLIYDTQKMKDTMPIFYDEYFILFNKKYDYRGTRIEKI